MKTLSVRKVDHRQHALKRAFRRWKTDGLNVTFSGALPLGKWVRISHPEGHWRGWLFLPELLALMSPGLAGMALTESFTQTIINWLSVSSEGLAGEFDAFPFTALRVESAVVEGRPPVTCMLCVTAHRLSLWIDEVSFLPPVNADPARLADSLAWPVRFIAGYSSVRLATCRQVVAGDILLIQNVRPVVACLDLDLFSYRLSAGESMDFEEWQKARDENNEDLLLTAEDRTEASPVRSTENVLPALDALPVQLEFVLYRKNMTLKELEQIADERLLKLPENQDVKVEILANGALIGRGELIQVDSYLGVEITTWLGETLNHE